jgi:capsule biosynthesis phosphatase
MKYILLCSGIGSRYNKYSLPKPLNYVYGKHMIEYVISNIPSNEIYIIYNIFLDEYNFKEIVTNKCKPKKIHFACVDYLTRGAVESAFIGIQQFHFQENDKENIVFIDNDNLHDLENLKGVFDSNFIGYSIDKTEKNNYSFIQIENHRVVDIAEKRKISDHFCCGLYGFVNTQKFIEYSKKVIHNNDKSNNEFYFSQLYKSILLNTQEENMATSAADAASTIKPVYIKTTQHIGSYKELTTAPEEINLCKPKLRICFDLDNTLVTYPTIAGDYSTVKPIKKNIDLLNMFHEEGHEIIVYTARRMATHKSNVGRVIKDIAATTINTLDLLNIPYDELIFGKPIADIYIDDRALNPYLNNISYYGFFTKTEDFLPNKVDTNKYNKITFCDNRIVKTGPSYFTRGELYFYQNIPLEISHLFPVFLGVSTGTTGMDAAALAAAQTITFEIEYIKGMPLFYLYKNRLITTKIIKDLFSILKQIHEEKSKDDAKISDKNIRNNYFEKLRRRFEKKSDYPFEDAVEVYQNIISGLSANYAAEKRSVIHGDFWFSNIIMTYDDQYKLIDMKGQVDGVLTLAGDRYYDYGKMYQSILGYDLILNDVAVDTEYVKSIEKYFLEKCAEIGLNIVYLKYVTKSLIFGTFHSIEKSENVKRNIWNLLKTII